MNSMGFNEVTSGERTQIAFFGMRNAGKSSLVNAVTNQQMSVVSDVKGTTTDPVKKAMELLPLGAVVIIDTPGFDDVGTLGEMRVQKTKEILFKTDIAVLVVDAQRGLSKKDEELKALFAEISVPYIIAYTKSDLLKNIPENGENEIYVSSREKRNITELKNMLGAFKKSEPSRKLISDLISAGDVAVLVTPIDAAAPKGRLILPQQQTIREILDCGAICAVTKETELEKTLSSLFVPPKIVVTDSQVFAFVQKIVPREIPLTSFSILFARYKGELSQLVKGARAIENLKSGDKVLISEGCTHHRQCGDIGSVKIPALLKKYTKKQFEFTFTSGGEFPNNLQEYALVIHCGGCMLNRREMLHRLTVAENSGTNIVNYGVAIAYMNGILERSTEMFDI